MIKTDCEKSSQGLLNQLMVMKPKKKLTFAERISVIHMFQSIRNTRKLAEIFECGRTQIQCILRRKNEILDEYSRNRTEVSIRNKHSVCLMILGVIMYEWIQRTRCYGVDLTKEVVCQTAQEVAKLLRMLDFRAPNTWFNRFRQKYKLFDLGPSPYINDPKVPKKSLNIKDIILELKNPNCKNFILLPKKLPYEYDPLKDFLNDFDDYTVNGISTPTEQDQVELISENSNDQEIKTVKEEQEYNSDLFSFSFTNELDIISVVNNKHQPSVRERQTKEVLWNVDHTDKNLKSLVTYTDALSYLKPLEEFVLYNANLRAVGLINPLEILFRENLPLNEI